MTKPDFDAAKSYAFELLATKLPPTLRYHTPEHTCDDVLPAVERLAKGEKVDGDALLCLQTAACFHDVGHIERSHNHEEIGVRIAARVLPRFGYTTAQITQICRLILATKVPQQPHSQLEQIIVDADMDSLGRDDFLATSLALREELALKGQHFSDAAWYERQIAFLQAHRYFTATAQRLRNPGKQRNINLLRELLAQCAAPD